MLIQFGHYEQILLTADHLLVNNVTPCHIDKQCTLLHQLEFSLPASHSRTCWWSADNKFFSDTDVRITAKVHTCQHSKADNLEMT